MSLQQQRVVNSWLRTLVIVCLALVLLVDITHAADQAKVGCRLNREGDCNVVTDGNNLALSYDPPSLKYGMFKGSEKIKCSTASSYYTNPLCRKKWYRKGQYRKITLHQQDESNVFNLDNVKSVPNVDSTSRIPTSQSPSIQISSVEDAPKPTLVNQVIESEKKTNPSSVVVTKPLDVKSVETKLVNENGLVPPLPNPINSKVDPKPRVEVLRVNETGFIPPTTTAPPKPTEQKPVDETGFVKPTEQPKVILPTTTAPPRPTVVNPKPVNETGFVKPTATAPPRPVEPKPIVVNPKPVNETGFVKPTIEQPKVLPPTSTAPPRLVDPKPSVVTPKPVDETGFIGKPIEPTKTQGREPIPISVPNTITKPIEPGTPVIMEPKSNIESPKAPTNPIGISETTKPVKPVDVLVPPPLPNPINSKVDPKPRVEVLRVNETGFIPPTTTAPPKPTEQKPVDETGFVKPTTEQKVISPTISAPPRPVEPQPVDETGFVKPASNPTRPSTTDPNPVPSIAIIPDETGSALPNEKQLDKIQTIETLPKPAQPTTTAPPKPTTVNEESLIQPKQPVDTESINAVTKSVDRLPNTVQSVDEIITPPTLSTPSESNNESTKPGEPITEPITKVLPKPTKPKPTEESEDKEEEIDEIDRILEEVEDASNDEEERQTKRVKYVKKKKPHKKFHLKGKESKKQKTPSQPPVSISAQTNAHGNIGILNIKTIISTNQENESPKRKKHVRKTPKKKCIYCKLRKLVNNIKERQQKEEQKRNCNSCNRPYRVVIPVIPNYSRSELLQNAIKKQTNTKDKTNGVLNLLRSPVINNSVSANKKKKMEEEFKRLFYRLPK